MSKAKQTDTPPSFPDHKQFPVSARKVAGEWESPRIDYSDYGRMSTQSHKPSGERRLPTPTWAVNDEQLRELLVCFLEERAGFRKQQPGTLLERLERAKAAIINQRPRLIATLTKLCAEYTSIKRLGAKPGVTDDEYNEAREQPYMAFAAGEARYVAEKKRLKDLENEIGGLDTFIRYTETDGGAATIAAAVYLYFRLRKDSVGVALELSMSPPWVRQTLWRLHQTAAKLWPLDETTKETLQSAVPFDILFE